MSEDARTGGQYCVTGLVLQLLVGLDRGLRLVIDGTRQDGQALVATTMVLEPDQGGDHALATPRGRLVEQVKLRTTGKAWTSGEIAGDVLPDLIKAVREDDGIPTRYLLVTDGALDCGSLLSLGRSLGARPVPDDAVAALGDTDGRAYFYGGWLSERGFFKALMARAKVDDPRRFWRLLAAFEAEGGVTEAQLQARIDAVLGDVVDAQEDIAGKRHEIVSRMAGIARSGGSVGAVALLEQAGLPADRLLHRARLPRIMAEGLRRDLEALGYDRVHDVREVPRAPGGDLLLFSGESGLGKSWRLSALLADEAARGRLALAVTNARSLDDVRRAIVERVWLSSFDREVELPALQRRVGRHFANAGGIWLTVGVDDVQDRSLANALHGADWQRYGIRVVATVPVQLADDLRQHPRPPAVQRVERFSRAQLRRFLAGHGLNARDLPDDVAELLCTPIFAELYRRGFAPDWRPANEYELVDGFWRHATFDTRGMADSQDDVAALEKAARLLLSPSGRYPWEIDDALVAGLGGEARARLVSTGILRQGPSGITLTHDRILNWLVARALAADLRRERRSVDEVAVLIQFDTPDAVAPGLAYRLGYVLMDLLWLCACTLTSETVLALIDAVLEAQGSRVSDGTFIENSLTTLGPAILPTLGLMAARPDVGHHWRAAPAARAIATVGRHHPANAQPVVARLLAQGGHALEMGLLAAADMAVPVAIEILWDIHHARKATLEAAPENLDIGPRSELLHATNTSFKALRRTAKDQCGWIETKLAITSDAFSAEILLKLLLAADHAQARDVWLRRKKAFLVRIPAGRNIQVRAIDRFGDADEADRLERTSENAHWFEPACRFNALLRVAPMRAVEQIEAVPKELFRRGWISVRRLVRHGGPEAQARLLARHGGGWEAVRDLVLTYSDDADLIDVPAFEAVLAALDERLAELAGTAWTPGGEGHLISFLSRTRRPDLLALLRDRRGSRLERLLCDLATGREGRSGLDADSDGKSIERLLLLIGGDGYGELAAAAVQRDTEFARMDGYRAVLRLPQNSPHAVGLAAAAIADRRQKHENYDLMVALAAQKLDAPLYDLVAAAATPYTDALSIRASLGPMDPAVAMRIRADLESLDGAVRIGATCALALAPPDDLADLLADTLAQCADNDESALTVVQLAKHLNAYAPRMLPQLRRMLALPNGKVREAVLPYLAAAGDAEARSVAAEHLSNEAPPAIDHCALKTAFSLSVNETVNGPGLERLKLLVDRDHSFLPIGPIVARLHERGAMSNEEVVELAYAARDLTDQDSAYLIQRVVQFDTEEAYGIAEHHFAQSAFSSAARYMLELGGDVALDHLLQSYLSKYRHLVRWVVARAIRRHADRNRVLERLALWAQRNAVDRRLGAATLLGWVPGARSAELLDQLAADPVPEVADAALVAEARLRSEDHARVLIAELAGADHLGRWARLQAIIELVDPYLLEPDSDGLQLEGVIDPFGVAFAISAERMIKARKDQLEKDADRRDRAAKA